MGAIISWGLVAVAVLGGFLLTRFQRRKTRQLVEQGMRSVNPVDLGSPVSANGRIEAERGKGDETTAYADCMSAARLGSLIQAASGSLGGVGGWWRNRAGFAL